MKKIFLFTVCFFIILLANAQSPTFQWASSIGGSDADYSECIAVDKWGSAFTAGRFIGTMDADPGSGVFNLTAAGVYGIFISKLDSAGNFAWGINLGGAAFYNEGLGITVDTFGNVYTTGYFQGTADFDPGVGTFYLTDSTSSYIPFILKLDGAGNFVWAKSLNGSASSPGGGQCNDISLDAMGNIYLAGGYRGTLDFDPGMSSDSMTAPWASSYFAFILKLDPSGSFVWAKSMDGDTSSVSTVSIDAANNVYTTGNFSGTVDFDPGVGTFFLTSTGSYDIFISKLDFAGNFVWAKRIGSALVDFVYDIAVSPSGDVYTSGAFEGTVDFDPGAGIYNLSCLGYLDMFISKLNPAGIFIWAKKIGDVGPGDIGYSIALDAANNVYTTGSFSGTVDFDPGVGTFYITAVGNINAFVSKLDSAGNMLWASGVAGSSGFSDTRANQLALDASDNIYLVGDYYGVPESFPPFTLTPHGTMYDDIFICKMGALSVWPGDANNDKTVDNNDLLPIGLFYGQTGAPRYAVSNAWQEFNVADWGSTQPNGANIKHADCNGDGTIDDNDTLAVNLNFALTHAFAPTNNDARLLAADLHFITSSSSYLSGSIVDVEVWLGNSTTSVSNLYGIAFDINYNASLVQPASESLTYPISWLGTPGTDAITIAKIDAVGNTAYGAETRINQINTSGFGKIADFKFQLKTSIPPNTVMNFSISGYQANDASGASVLFNAISDSIIINPSSVGIDERSIAEIKIFPNPGNGVFNIDVPASIKSGSIQVYNSICALIYKQQIVNQQNVIDLKDQANGLYFVKVIGESGVVAMKKVVKE